MTNKTLSRRCAGSVALVMLVASQACAGGVQQGGSATSQAAQQQQESATVEDQILVAVSKAIRAAHLTERPDECLAYRFDATSSREAYFVDVRENHRHASCGGDPQTQPRLFSVKVDRKTRKMFTDQGSPGQFHAFGG